jgi:hypothetical protein
MDAQLIDKHTIALLIPCTSRGRNWNKAEDTYLCTKLLPTFLLTLDTEHTYIVYLGYDHDDHIFSTEHNQSKIEMFCDKYTNISFCFVCYKDIKSGHLTKMWNILYKLAFDNQCDYFYQCGDDILFKTKGWVNDCIRILKINNNIGIAGPINNNPRILTQAFFTRNHMHTFGWLFPEEIINWCCDDWYNYLYSPLFLYPLSNHMCLNDGGQPRYLVNNDPLFKGTDTQLLRRSAYTLAQAHKIILDTYIYTLTIESKIINL